MGEYLIRIKLKYGEFSVSANTYAECMTKYKEIKEEYKNIPCEIIVTKQEKIQFVKQNKKDTMETLYNELKNVMIKIGQHQIDLLNEESEYNQIKNKLYHDLEETDTTNMSETEKAKYLDHMKLQLTKRRLTEIENQYNYAFYGCYNHILSAMEGYNVSKNRREKSGKERYNSQYYKEGVNVKKKKLNKLINEL